MKKILSGIMILVMTITLSSCGGLSPEETVDSFLKALKNGGETTELYEDKTFIFGKEGFIAEHKDYEKEFSEDEKAIVNQFDEKLKDFDYEIKGEEIDGDKAVVEVTIKTFSFGTGFQKMMEKFIEEAFALALDGASEEKVTEVTEKLSAEYLETVEKDYEKTVKIPLEKKDHKWIITTFNEKSEFADALSGGLLTELEKMDSFLE